VARAGAEDEKARRDDTEVEQTDDGHRDRRRPGDVATGVAVVGRE